MRLNDYHHMLDVTGKYGEIIQLEVNTISTYEPLNGFALEVEYTNIPTIIHISISGTYHEKNLFGEWKHISRG